MNKQQLAEHFNVALPTIDSWLRRGMPVVKKPKNRCDGYVFDLDEVSRWLDEYTQSKCTPAPANAPELLIARPDFMNSLRFYSEDGARHFLWYLLDHEHGVRILLALFREAGLSKKEAFRQLQTFTYFVTLCFTDWVNRDAYHAQFHKEGQNVDEVWRSLTGNKVKTRAPLDPDRVDLAIPDWILMKAEEYVENYWSEDD